MRVAIDACDVHDDLDTPRRAWVAGTSAPVVAVDIHGEDLLVAAVMPAAVIVKTVPIAQLRPVVTVETAVAPRAGGAPDPGLRVLPGFPLPVTTAPYIPVEAAGTLAFTGVVPAGVRGTIWEEVPNTDGGDTARAFEVHVEPREDSPVRATIHAGARVRARGPGAGEWVPIIARGEHAIVEGFVRVPPPPRPESGSFDFGDEIEGELISFLPVGTCLWDAPRGKKVGAIVGALYDRPTAAEPGWSAVVLATPWGKVTYYAHEDVVDPKPPTEWQFGNEWRDSMGR